MKTGRYPPIDAEKSGHPAEECRTFLESASRKNTPTTTEWKEYTNLPVLAIVRQQRPDSAVLRDLAIRARGFAQTLDGIASHPEWSANPQMLDGLIAQVDAIAVRAHKGLAA